MTALTSAVSKSAASTVALLLLGLAAWSGPAAAQQPSEAQVNAIRASCRGDFQAHCPGVQPGGSAAFACLKKNVAALSPACQKAVTAVGGAAAPAAAPPAPWLRWCRRPRRHRHLPPGLCPRRPGPRFRCAWSSPSCAAPAARMSRSIAPASVPAAGR